MGRLLNKLLWIQLLLVVVHGDVFPVHKKYDFRGSLQQGCLNHQSDPESCVQSPQSKSFKQRRPTGLLLDVENLREYPVDLDLSSDDSDVESNENLPVEMPEATARGSGQTQRKCSSYFFGALACLVFGYACKITAQGWCGAFRSS